jgi:hypothetical protein
MSPAASDDGRPRQHWTVRAHAQTSDQNPAAAVRGIPTQSFSFSESDPRRDAFARAFRI